MRRRAVGDQFVGDALGLVDRNGETQSDGTALAIRGVAAEGGDRGALLTAARYPSAEVRRSIETDPAAWTVEYLHGFTLAVDVGWLSR